MNTWENKNHCVKKQEPLHDKHMLVVDQVWKNSIHNNHGGTGIGV